MYTPPVATTDRTILRGIWTGICLEGRSSGWFEGCACRERAQAWSFRGSKSRNKVSVGEPAEGSLPILRVLLAGLRRDFARFSRANVPLRTSTASGPSESASTESIAAQREKGGNALYPRPTLFRVAKGRRLFSLFFPPLLFPWERVRGREGERARRSSPCEARRVDFRKLGASLASKSLCF